MVEPDLSDAIVEVVANRDATDVLAGLTEAVIDRMLQDGLGRDIPILSSVLGILRAAGAVRNLSFIKKLVRFAVGVGDVADNERAEFRSQIDRDPEFRAEVGENLLLLMERLDDMQKPALIGRLFAAFLRKRLNYTELRLACIAVDRAFYQDLLMIANGKCPENVEIAARLYSAGLALSHVVDLRTLSPQIGGLARASQHYQLNSIGQTVALHCFRWSGK